MDTPKLSSPHGQGWNLRGKSPMGKHRCLPGRVQHVYLGLRVVIMI